MFDLPQPFGPTMAAMPSPLNRSSVRSQNDLNPCSSTRFSFSKTLTSPCSGGLVTILNAIREKVKHCHPIITWYCAGGYDMLGAVSGFWVVRLGSEKQTGWQAEAPAPLGAKSLDSKVGQTLSSVNPAVHPSFSRLPRHPDPRRQVRFPAPGGAEDRAGRATSPAGGTSGRPPLSADSRACRESATQPAHPAPPATRSSSGFRSSRGSSDCPGSR